MLAMPPQAFPLFSQNVSEVREHPGLVISIMAGVKIESIQAALRVQRVVRMIPNTPAEVFEGMTLYCKSSFVDNASIDMTRRILESIGQYAELQNEALIDAGTALCGGGPAFVSYFADALQKFGEQAGIGEEESRQVVVQLLRGTAALLEATKSLHCRFVVK